MNLDLDKIIAYDGIELVIKKSAAEDNADASLRRLKEKITFIVGMSIVILAFLFSIYSLLKNPSNPLAANLLIAIVTGFIGFIVGRKTKHYH